MLHVAWIKIHWNFKVQDRWFCNFICKMVFCRFSWFGHNSFRINCIRIGCIKISCYIISCFSISCFRISCFSISCFRISCFRISWYNCPFIHLVRFMRIDWSRGMKVVWIWWFYSNLLFYPDSMVCSIIQVINTRHRPGI